MLLLLRSPLGVGWEVRRACCRHSSGCFARRTVSSSPSRYGAPSVPRRWAWLRVPGHGVRVARGYSATTPCRYLQCPSTPRTACAVAAVVGGRGGCVGGPAAVGGGVGLHLCGVG